MNHPVHPANQPDAATPGFATPIEDGTELTEGLLAAEFHEGGWQPIGSVISIAEARLLAEDDLRRRMRDLEAGGDPACPEQYVVWARGIGGAYHVAARLEP